MIFNAVPHGLASHKVRVTSERVSVEEKTGKDVAGERDELVEEGYRCEQVFNIDIT